MSNYIFDMPYGGELVPDPPSHAFGKELYSAFFCLTTSPSTLSGHVSPRFRPIASDRARHG